MPRKDRSRVPSKHASSGARESLRQPPPGAIREQLERILTSDEFQAATRIRDFLRFIVEETLAGRSDQLKGYTIATAVMDRGKDFDPGQDPIVRIQAGRLRRALERYYLVAGGDDPIVIDVPKGRYIPRFKLRSTAHTTQARAKTRDPEPAPAQKPAVAVLPLKNLSGDQDRQFFALGLTEELVTELDSYLELNVIPCHRAMVGGKAPDDLENFCRSLGARFLLSGSIRCDIKLVKAAVHLLDTTTGRKVWSGTFKHSLEATSLIETQEEIARSVAATVGSEYGIIARRLTAESRTKSPADLNTYEAMLLYLSYQIAPSPAASERCFAALQAAVERDPDYGPVWSALGSLYCQMYVWDVPGFDDPLAVGRDYAERGVALEPDRQGSRLIRAYAMLLDDDLAAFHEEAEATLALNPTSPYVTGTIGFLAVHAGDFQRGRTLLDRAMASNPIYPQWFRHGIYLERFQAGDFEGALKAVRGHDEAGFWYLALMAAALGKLGRIEEAQPWLTKLLAEKPDLPARAEELISRTIKVKELVGEIVDGLVQAGMTRAG